MKDVGEYFDRLEVLWRDRDVWVEAIGERPFEYDEADPPQSLGHVLVRITFPNHADPYLKVDEWLVAVGRKHIRRESYVFEFIVEGAVVDDWHLHRDEGGTDP